MSTTIDETTTVENKPRSLTELLKLDTYQGMTDEEITSIIDFKCERAVALSEIRVKTEIMTTEMEARIQQNAESIQRAHDMVQSMLNRKVANDNFVQPKTVTPRSIGE